VNGRNLTANEIILAKKVFKDAIDYKKVIIHNEKYIFFQPANSGMTPNGEIYVDGFYKKDYSSVNGFGKAFFIHEMTHVWQYQLKILNPITAAITENIKHFFNYDKAYEYELAAGKDLLDYNIEQQASIIEDYFRIHIAKIKPFPGRMKNSLADVNKDLLFEKALAKFLSSPRYAEHTIKCKRNRFGPHGKGRLICNRVRVNE
jgi:type VI secretion system secreted protein VgrG